MNYFINSADKFCAYFLFIRLFSYILYHFCKPIFLVYSHIMLFFVSPDFFRNTLPFLLFIHYFYINHVDTFSQNFNFFFCFHIVFDIIYINFFFNYKGTILLRNISVFSTLFTSNYRYSYLMYGDKLLTLQ